MTHFGLYLTVSRPIMIGEWRKLVHPLIFTLWFWFYCFQIDIVTQYTFSPLYDNIMGPCRTNYGQARGAEAQNILHYPHKQLWVKKTWFHTTAIQSHFFGPQLPDYKCPIKSLIWSPPAFHNQSQFGKTVQKVVLNELWQQWFNASEKNQI